MPFFDPTRHHVFFNDFNQYAAADWVVTKTQGGATQATVSGDGGLLAMVNTAADNDVNSIQQAFPSFTFADGKAMMIKTCFKLSDATQSDAAVGLLAVDTSPIQSAPTDGLYFLKDDDAATVKFTVGTGSAYTSTGALLTMADDTFYTLGAFCNGKAFVKPSDGLTYYSFLVYGGLSSLSNDPAFITRLDVLNSAVPSATVLAATIANQAGAASAQTMTTDFLFISKER